ncbi:MAG TPA: triple tyrosine motif-containing protein [Marivirga sp.]|nr:triple tyrosine motif-containing protein [Marivirga sp.]
MKHFILLFLLLLSSQIVMSQKGDVPLHHYEVPLPPQDYIFNDLTIDNQGRLLAAYKKGILQFDGNSWLKIEINSSPIKFLNINNQKYLLAKDGIYKMSEDNFNKLKFELLHAIPINSVVADLIYNKGKYYLLANDLITVLDQDFNKINTYESKLGYKDIFVFNSKLYAFAGNFLLENIDGVWVDLNLFAPDNTDFLFSVKGNNNLYFAYDNGDFYSFNGKDFEPYSSELNQYFKENYPISGKFLDQKIIISTLSGGVVLAEESTGKIISTIQNYNGLPTNEVTALTMDFQNGLWLAHPYGISRASLNIPLSDFQFYPGLEGLPEVTLVRKDTFWVGTTEGLFYLKEVKDYETLQKKLIQKVKISNPESISAEGDDETGNIFGDLFSFGNDSKEEEFIKNELKKYRSIYREKGIRFKELRNKLDEKEQELKDSIQNVDKKKNKNATSPLKYRSVVKTINVSRLKSIDFEYQRIEQLDQHVESLISTEHGLIARSNTGVFLIKAGKANKITNLRMVKKLLYSSVSTTLWVTNEQGLFSFDLLSENYNPKQHSTHAYHDLLIFQNQLIAVGANLLEIFEINNSSLKTIRKLNIINNYSEEMAVFTNEGEIKLLSSEAILSVSTNSNEFKIDSLFQNPLNYFLKDQNEEVWILSSQNEWSTLNGELSNQAKKWLHIVPPIKNINVLNDSTIFFTTNERIVQWKSSLLKDYDTPMTFIDGVKVDHKWLKNNDLIKLNHGQNNLKIILSTPEYLFKEDVIYQYYVKGLMDDWSSWSKSREIDFPYIPTGDYKLQVKARTILDNETTSFNLDFKILPPYWRTWWFYLLEIIFFSILILISIRLNTTNQSSYLTKTFTFLTLILFLEFLATIAENNLAGYVDDSPVYTFIINVVLALSISPIEKGISKLLVIFNTARAKNLISELRKNQLKRKNEPN